MSLINNGIGNFSQEIKNIMGEVEGVFDLKPQSSDTPNASKEESATSSPLSKDEMKAFIGLCSLEGINIQEKIAELIKDYIQEKRKQMRK